LPRFIFSVRKLFDNVIAEYIATTPPEDFVFDSSNFVYAAILGNEIWTVEE